MDTNKATKRAFVQYSKIDVASNSLPENSYEKFSIGIFEEQQVQFSIIFYTFAGIPSVKLEAACNSWSFLYECQDILEALSRVDTENFKPEDAYHMLIGLGIRDITDKVDSISNS